MWTAGSRIKVVVGHYGSGKTELALNMARQIARAGKTVSLVDLDIVNPFFRSAERGDWLRSQGIRLHAPEFALSAVDVPSLPASIQSVFEGAQYAVFDVGGDDAGARALGQYKAQFERSGYELIYVINIHRPRSDRVEQIVDMMRRVAAWSRLTPTFLVNNANLGDETGPEDLLAGLALLARVTEATGVPVIASTGMAAALAGVPGPTFAIERLMKPEWMGLT